MTDRIEPALTAEQWEAKAIEHGSLTASVDEYGSGPWFTASGEYEPFSTQDARALAAVIALANAALPDTDPRKITREWVEELRGVAEQLPTMGAGPNGEDIPDPMLTRMADALESYLPPG